jgi:hypothetical protein
LFVNHFLELSVKSGKYSTSNPEFGHKEDRIEKDLKRRCICIQRGGWGRAWWGVIFLSFTLFFSFPERLHCCYISYIYLRCSYLYSCNSSSRTLCIKCWVLIKIPYFTDTTERGVRGWKEAHRQAERQGGWIYGFPYYVTQLPLELFPTKAQQTEISPLKLKGNFMFQETTILKGSFFWGGGGLPSSCAKTKFLI